MNGSAKLVKKLYEVAGLSDKGFGYQANELLRLGCELLDLEIGAIVRVEGAKTEVKFVVSPLMSIKEGQPLPSYGVLGMQANIEVPLKVNGEPYGKLTFAGRQPKKRGFTVEQKDTVNLMSVWLSREMERLRREKELLDSSRKMQALVKFDSLTGMYSRPSIEGRLQRLLQRSQFTEEPVSAAVVDIDGFTRIENRYGKLGADMAITAVAQAIDEAVRPTDPSARIGDDEFLILLVGANESQAKIVAGRIQQHISANFIEVAGERIQLSASIAVIELSEEITHIEEILKDTHARLVFAKNKGKGRVL
jgi:diguanylate cyclase (GGDEF)-like protein